MRFSVLVIILILFTFFLQAQTIKGRIVDAESGKPIHGANIYLNGTYQGTSSNNEGNFTLNTTERNIPLIVSHVGYQSQTISDYTGKNLNILLKRKAIVLREVTIGKDDREVQMRIFLREFIGTKNHECTIANPNDISFTYHKKSNQLIASASQPLLIYNKKLGYKITYFLSFFKYTPLNMAFQGNYFFAEDTAGLSLKDQKRILRNRDNVYYGSRMHFARALWSGNFMDEGFILANKNDMPLVYNDIITKHADKKHIRINDYINIDYKLQNSYLAPIDTGRQTFIAANGFYDPNINWGGEMGSQRMGELLPFEFEPFDHPAPMESPPAQVNSVKIEQGNIASDSLIKKFKYYSVKKQQGILYAHFDKTIYTNNENVWFTAYLLNANVNRNDVLSVMLINDNDHSIAMQDKFIMDRGISFGNLFLPDSVLSGNYSFMLYTNSVLNGKPENVFVQPVTIKNTSATTYKATLFLEDTARIPPKTGRKVLLITQANGAKLISGAAVSYYLGDRSHPIIAGKVKTDAAGQYLITIPATANISLGNNVLQAEVSYGKEVKTLKLNLPVQTNTPVVKFYPEGGNLSDATLSVVGWEVKNTAGVPYAVKGVLYENNTSIDTLNTNSYGVGRFALTPHQKSRYYVKLMLADNRDSAYNLPPILTNSPVVTLTSAIVADTLRLVVKNKLPTKLYVLVHNYKQTFFSFPVQADSNGTRVKIDLTELPRGLAEITILDSLQRPFAERLFFAHYNQHNTLTIEANKSEYKTRQKVNLKLDLKDAEGKPITGFVSIACVQSNCLETKKVTDIESYLYLNHELGELPVKQNYLGNSSADKAFLENILLIKGWRRYTWPELMNVTREDSIRLYDSLNFKGTITRFDKPLKKPVNFIIMRDSVLNTSLTGINGSFRLFNNDLHVVEGKKVYLFVTGDSREDYKFNLSDPYDKVNKSLAGNYEAPNHNNFLLNEVKDNIDDLKGFEHAIQLKEVKIKGANDNSLYGGKPLENACGDYVCKYHILNCPNHRGDPQNTLPVAGGNYLQYNVGVGKLTPVTYFGCVEHKYEGAKILDGIHYTMEFYPADYAKINPSEPEYLSTIYWNHLYKITPGKEASISFYTSDITGDFKIIVQGVADKDVIYGEGSFTVNK